MTAACLHLKDIINAQLPKSVFHWCVLCVLCVLCVCCVCECMCVVVESTRDSDAKGMDM